MINMQKLLENNSIFLFLVKKAKNDTFYTILKWIIDSQNLETI